MIRLIHLFVFVIISFSLVAQIRDTITPFPKDSLVYVRTKGPMAYLNYGLGEDRLGGAKWVI